MADQDQKQQSRSDPAARAEAVSRNQKDYGTSEVDAMQGSTDQGIKNKVAQETNLHKDQYPEVLEDTPSQSKGGGDKPGEYGTSEVDARQGSMDQGLKDKVAQETNLHKDQYPETLEDIPSQSKGGGQERGR